MFTREELEEYRNVLGFNLWQVEKDYLQHMFLLFLHQRINRELIFKGGTALQKTFGLNRFSIDLDFTSSNNGIGERIKEVAKDITNFGFPASLGEVERTETSKIAKVRIEGPLYDGSERTMTVLRIEISLRDLVLEPMIKEIVPIYSDLRPYFIVLMDLREILAEKARALIWRTDARDLYDLWFLLRKNVKVNVALVDRKLSYHNLKFDKEEFLGKVNDLRKTWDRELKPIVSALPPFEEVEKDIKETLLAL